MLKFIMIVWVLFISGCGMTKGLPLSSSEKGVYYYFPKVSVSVDKRFYEKSTDTYSNQWYEEKLVKILRKSHYFLEVQSAKSTYHVFVKYRQFTYTSWANKVVSWFTPAGLFGGIDLDMEYVVTIQLKHQGKTFEKYVYKEAYSGKHNSVQKKGERFFEKSIKRFLEVLPTKSKMKHIRQVEQ